MNRSKTKVMTNSTKIRVEVDRQENHYVDEHLYLGQLVNSSKTGNIEKSIALYSALSVKPAEF